MFGENKNLKDSGKDPVKDTSSMPTSYQTLSFGSVSYTKTNKLITALYMVTDILDKDEPLRFKLRTLGVGILSDINSNLPTIPIKISEIMSFIDIASAVNIISEMNCNILRKEFLELNRSVQEYMRNSESKIDTFNRPVNLSEFFGEGEEPRPPLPFGHLPLSRGREISKGHARIGVQKGSTLMRALSDRKLIVSLSRPSLSDKNNITKSNHNFDILKKQRRDNIISILKLIDGGATIKNIKDKANLNPKENNPLVSCGEKTLQRELVSMVKDGVLNKTGEKRWSKYFTKLE